MALLQISEPGDSPDPHQRRIAVGIDLGTTHSLVAAVRNGVAECLPDAAGHVILPSAVRYLEQSGLTADQLATGGYTIKTTMDPVVSQTVKDAVDRNVPTAQDGVANTFAVVAPGNGGHDVLAMVANRNLGTDAAKGERSTNIVADPSNVFGAGSSFKIFTTAAALITSLTRALTEGRLDDRLKVYTVPRLLIIDEIGYLPIDRAGANLFFQLISRRYERGPMILTSNQSFGSWGDVFGDRVIATAILDRVLHHAITINIRGNSYRLKDKLKAGLVKPVEATTT